MKLEQLSYKLRFPQKQIDDKPKQTNKLFGTLFQITFYYISEKHSPCLTRTTIRKLLWLGQG